jgi:hypothetical protein
MTKELGNRIIALRELIVGKFKAGDWEEAGLLSGQSDAIDQYPRLLRSLEWGDTDYPANVLGVLRQIAEGDQKAFSIIEQHAHNKVAEGTEYISAKPSKRRITFAPNVFTVPELPQEPDLAVVMMPFSAEFTPIYKAIRRACKTAGLRCLRVDDIWEESIIIQDVFNLIFRSRIVIVDFTGKNPNVMYETGIAHTLGKHVVPISQSMADVPFDLKHHRTLTYLNNEQGRAKLEERLATRLQQLGLGTEE